MRQKLIVAMVGIATSALFLFLVAKTNSQSSANANAANRRPSNVMANAANRPVSNALTINRYDRFWAEINSEGRLAGLTQPYLPSNSGGAGCTNPSYKSGVITSVRYADSYKYDGKHVSGFSVRYTDGKRDSFDEEVSCCFGVWERPYAERQFLESVFEKDRQITVGVEYCGTAMYKTLYSIRDNSKRTPFHKLPDQTTEELIIGTIDNAASYLDGPGCYFRPSGSAKTAKTYVFLGEGAGSILRNGSVETNKERVWLKINGRVQSFDLVSTTRKKNTQIQKGRSYVETYRSGDTTIRITKTVTGHEYYDGGELSSAIVTVTSGGMSKTVKAVGICGM